MVSGPVVKAEIRLLDKPFPTTNQEIGGFFPKCWWIQSGIRLIPKRRRTQTVSQNAAMVMSSLAKSKGVKDRIFSQGMRDMTGLRLRRTAA